MMPTPVRKVSFAILQAHSMNSFPEAFFISVKKYTRPNDSSWIRVGLIKISSRGPLLRVRGNSPLKIGVDKTGCWRRVAVRSARGSHVFGAKVHRLAVVVAQLHRCLNNRQNEP